MDYSRIVKEILTKLNLTHRSLAFRLNCHFTSIGDWSRGSHKPRGRNRERLLDLYKRINNNE